MQLLVALPMAVALLGAPGLQTPAPQAPAPTQPAAPRPRPAAPSNATAVLTVTVNDASGAPIADVKVSAKGPLEREGITTAAGQVRLLGIRAGTYRLRFEKDGFHTFEKELTWRAGTPAPVSEATLTAAPPPTPPPPAPEPAKPAAPEFVPEFPAGQASNLSIPDYIEKNHITAKEPHKESLIGCSGGAQTWLWQVRESWTNRQHETAELTMYFVGGDGTLTLNGRNIQVAAGMLAVVPRGTEYGLTRNPKGRAAALYVVATLSGPPCAK